MSPVSSPFPRDPGHRTPGGGLAPHPCTSVPGVRSEPRPALVSAPRPPPSGGNVKPGGEGGGGGSPTRAGAGGGGGPAGGELAANTFPMVVCEGRGQRAKTQPQQTPAWLRAPVLTGGGARSRPGLRSHPVRYAQPNTLPPPPPPSPRPA
ncbi:hypothetical protein P7K49_034558 [Saguinus oedipus]|uniref:Uncharacterized protein n=1 Tax=Saguinus oedipus TaxID=9490 RepID=A0ABQ9TV15_SAGOE|nr:hypothetical protein P7K49_034558 [Saguinus oedipus]